MNFLMTLAALAGLLSAIITIYKDRDTALEIAKIILTVIDSKPFTRFRIGLCIIVLALTIFTGGLLVLVGIHKGFSLPVSLLMGMLYATSFMPLAYLTFRDTIKLK